MSIDNLSQAIDLGSVNGRFEAPGGGACTRLNPRGRKRCLCNDKFRDVPLAGFLIPRALRSNLVDVVIITVASYTWLDLVQKLLLKLDNLLLLSNYF